MKRQKLLELANSILDSSKYKHEFNFLIEKFNIKKDQLLQSFLDYNLDIFSIEGNAIYSSLPNRIVLHMHNLITGSWHEERQRIVYDFVVLSNAKSMADVGFGVPSLYLNKILNEHNELYVTLCDLYDSAFQFAKELLGCWQEDWSRQINFTKTDMNQNAYIGDYDLFIFQDSIEHTLDPTAYLINYVQMSKDQTKFLFSLPIGPIIPQHYIAWHTSAEAEGWLRKCGLKVIKSENVYVNPEVDLFAEQLNFNYCNYIVLCEKIL